MEGVQEKLIAKTIFYEFEIFQNTTVSGFCEIMPRILEERGKVVIAELERLDILENTLPDKQGVRRKRVKPPNSVGGYVSQKIFKYDRRVEDGEITYRFWRFQ